MYTLIAKFPLVTASELERRGKADGTEGIRGQDEGAIGGKS
jgi:hypothetical protein